MPSDRDLKPIADDPEDLYPDHLDQLQGGMMDALSGHELDAVVIAAGDSVPYHRDDTGQVFRPNAAFARWTSGLDTERDQDAGNSARLTYSPGHMLFFDPERDARPKLFVSTDAKSPWYLPVGVPPAAEKYFDVETVNTREQLWEALEPRLAGRHVAYIGQRDAAVTAAIEQGKITHEPGSFMVDVERQGLRKTPFEIAAIRRANERTALGHVAAKRSFLRGGSEGEILADFVRATGQREVYNSYPAIVALSPHGAALHYESADFGYRKGESMLLDAGTTDLWYPADVTSTFVKPGAHPVFKQLLSGLDKIQKELVKMVNADGHFNDVQRAMYLKLAELLIEVGILKGCTPQEAAEAHYTHAFCPHSVGHSLGIQTHDKGQFPVNADGKRFLIESEDPILNKSTAARVDFAEDQVVTVEPGIYFISALLEQYRNNPHFNWQLIDELEGGMRIETNIWITRAATRGNIDLTRLALRKGTNV